MPQLNFRWPEKDIAVAKQWAEKNGRSLNSEVHRIVMEFIIREESREAKA
ncbi:TPA: Arc family DNA-binding protein [Providencia alcalifaciens]